MSSTRKANSSLRIYIVFIVLIVGTGFSVFLLNQVIINREIEKRDAQLQNINSAAISRLESSLNQFATITSGLRSYAHQSPKMPSALQFQKFTNNLLKDLDFRSPYVISYIDTTHIFTYVFEKNRIDPNRLSGNPIPQRSNEAIIRRMDSIMLTRELHLSKPVNLLEGWVGISFSFGVFRNGQSIGYITPAFSLKKVLDDIYSEPIADDFIFKFTVGGHAFDRRAIYDQTPIYNNEFDSLNYSNFEANENDFIYSSTEVFGRRITVGTAHKENVSFFNLITFAIMIGFFLFIMAFWYISQQTIRFERLNEELLIAQSVVHQQKEDLEIQNKELSQLNSTKDRFFSIIGHDIKSPLATLSTMVDLKQKEKLPDMSEEEIMDRVKSSVDRTLILLDNLLRWSMLSSNKIKPDFQIVDLSGCLEESIELVKEDANDKNIEIVVEKNGHMMANVDKNMISSCIRNLLSNAIKFTADGGRIKVEASSGQDKHQISITDSGIGIPENELELIFNLEKDQRIGTKGETGSGLGLVLTKEFMDKNHGRIEVQSETDKGSIFTMILPSSSIADKA